MTPEQTRKAWKDLAQSCVDAITHTMQGDKLLAKIAAKQEKILNRQIARHQIALTSEAAEEDRKQWISHMELAICLETNGDGKPAFKNEAQRKAELQNRKQDLNQKNIQSGSNYLRLEIDARNARRTLEEYDLHTQAMENFCSLRFAAVKLETAKLQAVGNLAFFS